MRERLHLRKTLNERKGYEKMIRNNRIKKVIVLLMVAVLALSFAACGGNKGGSMDKNPKNAKEAKAMYNSLMTQENEILSKNKDLWEKVFMSADKGMTMIEDGGNYGDFLLKTIESAKDQFSADELKLLMEEGEKIRKIEVKLTELENKYPELGKKDSSGGESVPADMASGKFPAFTGKDLDGNEVSSDKLFSANAVTVVNLWFTTCSPCVGELEDLEKLSKELAKKGGTLIGVNSFTLGGDSKAIAEAKEVLSKKNVSYKNVYFDSNSEAGKFVTNTYAFPTSYVVDRKGNIVGDPIVGAVTGKKQMETLMSLIEKAIANDKA